MGRRGRAVDGGMQSTGRSGWLSVGGAGVKLTPGGREASAGNSVREALGEDSAGNGRSGSWWWISHGNG